MKKILLLLAITVHAAALSQESITTYYGILPNGGEPDGYSHRTYTVLGSSVPLDESASGEDVNWYFDGLFFVGNTTYDNTVPTAAQIAEYPGTTMVTNQVSDLGNAEIFFADNGGELAVTGISSDGLQLNYSDNNATIGSFPLTYGETNTNAVSGTYVFDTYSGNFDGTITTTYDAYGTLDNDFLNDPQTVYRIKTVQNLSMDYLIFPDAGTVTQTLYYYYRNSNELGLFPWFKSTTTVIDVPMAGINETQTVIEQAIPALLAVNESENDVIGIFPNPATHSISVSGNDVVSIAVVDVNGKTIGTFNSNTVNVSGLPNGVYFARIKTSSGETVKKFIKN